MTERSAFNDNKISRLNSFHRLLGVVVVGFQLACVHDRARALFAFYSEFGVPNAATNFGIKFTR